MVKKEIEVSEWKSVPIRDMDYNWNTDFGLTYKSQLQLFRIVVFDRPQDLEVISIKSVWVKGEGIINVFPEFNGHRDGKIKVFVMINPEIFTSRPIIVSYWVTDIEQEKRNVLQKILTLETEIDYLRKELDRLYACSKTA